MAFDNIVLRFKKKKNFLTISDGRRKKILVNFFVLFSIVKFSIFTPLNCKENGGSRIHPCEIDLHHR